MAVSEAIKEVFEQAIQDLMEMGLSTPPAERAARIVVIRETLRIRLTERGISPERAALIAKDVKFEVSIAGDNN